MLIFENWDLFCLIKKGCKLHAIKYRIPKKIDGILHQKCLGSFKNFACVKKNK